jgi:predicted esterase
MFKIGLLHGCCQHAEMFTGLLREYIKKFTKHFSVESVEFVPIEAQYSHPEKGKMWFKTLLELGRINTDDIPEEDINETLDYIQSIIKEKNVNFLIGFSQGGNVVSTYLRLRNNDKHIKGSILMSSYDFPRYSRCNITIPILYIGSRQDEIVKFTLFPQSCDDITIMEHHKAHSVYQNKAFITKVIEWMETL